MKLSCFYQLHLLSILVLIHLGNSNDIKGLYQDANIPQLQQHTSVNPEHGVDAVLREANDGDNFKFKGSVYQHLMNFVGGTVLGSKVGSSYHYNKNWKWDNPYQMVIKKLTRVLKNKIFDTGHLSLSFPESCLADLNQTGTSAEKGSIWAVQSKLNTDATGYIIHV